MQCELLTTAEACRFLAIGKTTLYAMARRGKIRRTRIGRATRWRRTELERFVERCTRQGG